LCTPVCTSGTAELPDGILLWYEYVKKVEFEKLESFVIQNFCLKQIHLYHNHTQNCISYKGWYFEMKNVLKIFVINFYISNIDLQWLKFGSVSFVAIWNMHL
jgi:hypothetical protein